MSMLFKRIKDWATSITAFRTGDVIPVDGPSGTAKMAKDDLLQVTAENALKDCIAVAENAIFQDRITNPADLNDIKDNGVTFVQRSNSTATLNFPSDYPTDSQRGYLLVIKTKLTSVVEAAYQWLLLPTIGYIWYRTYNFSTQVWSNWTKSGIDYPQVPVVTKNAIFQDRITNPADLNDLKDNTLTAVIRNAATTTLNFPSNYPTDSQKGFLLVTKESWTSAIDVASQMLFIPASGKCWFRTYNFSSQVWSAWDNYLPKEEEEITIGSGGDYATLRAGFTYACSKTNCRVKVLPGTYDLTVEFADVLHSISSTTGLPVGRGMKVFFCDGALVTAEFDNSENEWTQEEWEKILDYFNPFYANYGDFEIENLNIVAQNCRYCFHDERSGTGTYRHVYKNCHMIKKTTTPERRYMCCIGGGLGEHGTIVVDGGDYESDTTYGIDVVDSGEVTSAQMCILFHNGPNDNEKSSIEIKNVYLHNRGYVCIRDWSDSANVTKVLVSSCSFGLPIAHFKISAGSSDNMEVIEWNNEQRVQGVHWEPSVDGSTIDLVAD